MRIGFLHPKSSQIDYILKRFWTQNGRCCRLHCAAVPGSKCPSPWYDLGLGAHHRRPRPCWWPTPHWSCRRPSPKGLLAAAHWVLEPRPVVRCWHWQANRRSLPAEVWGSGDNTQCKPRKSWEVENSSTCVWCSNTFQSNYGNLYPEYSSTVLLEGVQSMLFPRRWESQAAQKAQWFWPQIDVCNDGSGEGQKRCPEGFSCAEHFLNPKRMTLQKPSKFEGLDSFCSNSIQIQPKKKPVVLGGWLNCDTVMRSKGWVRPFAIKKAASKTWKFSPFGGKKPVLLRRPLQGKDPWKADDVCSSMCDVVVVILFQHPEKPLWAFDS